MEERDRECSNPVSESLFSEITGLSSASPIWDWQYDYYYVGGGGNEIVASAATTALESFAPDCSLLPYRDLFFQADDILPSMFDTTDHIEFNGYNAGDGRLVDVLERISSNKGADDHQKPIIMSVEEITTTTTTAATCSSSSSNSSTAASTNNSTTTSAATTAVAAAAADREHQERCLSYLTFEQVSQYFYMPITRAARELNVGLTLLKKRCRELGIPRWPHRKMKSLQTLINNVQELGMENGIAGETQLRCALDILEEEKKMIENKPEIQLEEKTKRLRQAYFKANYKKRRLLMDPAGQN